MGGRGVARPLGYATRFAALALALWPALVPLAETDLERTRPWAEPTVPKTGTANVRVLGVNDLHGNLEPPLAEGGRASGGVAYLDAHMDLYERVRPEGTIRVHAGDMVGGSPLISSRFHDEPAILAMNEMGFDVGTLGNHEFDEGGEEMFRLLKGDREIGTGLPTGGANASDPAFPGASFPYVAANTVRAGSGEPVLSPYAVVERDGAKIGFVGVTTPDTPEGLTPEAAAPFRFLDISETVNRYVSQLRGRGVEAIVVLAHAGGTGGDRTPARGEIFREAAEMSEAVDVVVAGHTHAVLDERVGNKIIVEAGEYGTAFSVVDLEVDRRTGDVAGARAEVVPVRNDAVRPDGALADLVAQYEKRVAPFSRRVVAEAAEDVPRAGNASGESALGDLVADAQRSFAGADLAFVNPMGLRADVEAGPVTYGELFAALPFGQDVVRVDLSGDAVLRLLEQQHSRERSRVLQVSGLSYALDRSRAEGQRVTEATLEDGSPVERRTTYSVAADTALALGGDGFSVFLEGEDRRVVGEDTGALVLHLEALSRPFVAPEPDEERRIRTTG